jgi:hypothetical protein
MLYPKSGTGHNNRLHSDRFSAPLRGSKAAREPSIPYNPDQNAMVVINYQEQLQPGHPGEVRQQLKRGCLQHQISSI